MNEQNEKQAIEEMAQVMYDILPGYDLTRRDCIDAAEVLFAKGYHKQIKAEWKSGTKNGQYGYYCTNCDAGFTGENAEWIAKEHDFCPNCGARMKGGRNEHKHI